MKSSEVMVSVKRWFSLRNYDVLQEITVNDLSDEINRRASLLRYDFDYGNDTRRLRCLEYEARILAGNPLLVSSTIKASPTTRKINPLTDASLHVRHITVADIGRYEARLRELDLLRRGDGSSGPVSKEDGRRRLTDIDELNADHPLYLWLNIALLTDEEVVEHVKRMLPRWRKEHGTGEPAINTFRFGLSTVKKLIHLRIIPMLDLMLWEKRNGARISYEQMARLLYPDDSNMIRGGAQIKDTDRPLAERALTREFDRLFNLWLSKNDYLMDTKIADVMKMDEEDTVSGTTTTGVLKTTGNASVASDLTVGGTSTLNGLVNINNNLKVKSDTYLNTLSTTGLAKFGGRIATNGLNPNDLPSGWAGGGKTVNAYINSAGNIFASGNLTAGTIKSNGTI